MKKFYAYIVFTSILYSSYCQIPEEYIPANLDIYESDSTKYTLNADGTVDVKSIPRPDCQAFGDLATYFYIDAEKIFVIPDAIEDEINYKRIMDAYSGVYKNSIFKKESELDQTDLQKVLVLYAPLHYYSDWERFKLPVFKIENGFSFHGQEYTNENDGIFYLSPNRIVKTGNSFSPVWNLYNSYGILYKYVLINDNMYVRYGMLNGHEIDLEKIRTSNYNSIATPFYNFYVSKSVRVDPSEYDVYVEEICKTMDLDIPDFRIPCMVHGDPNEARLFSNWFPLLGCDIMNKDMIFGAAINGIIHVIGEDKGLIRHESFHAIWDGIVGIRNNFFAEGAQMYYEFLCDSSKIPAALEVVKKYKDHDIQAWILENDFYNAPQENNQLISYPISGLFSMFLIEKYGLDTYKLLFRAEKGESGFLELYKLSYDSLLAEYYSWVDSR